MFKDRTIQVDLVKKGTSSRTDVDANEIGFEDKAKIVAEVVEKGIKRVGWIMGTYVILDTIRKVVVASTNR